MVHIASGCAGLASVCVVGNRKGFGKERFEPHNILYTVVGASMLWFGWLGFNGGSALSASDGRAGMAALVTQISAAMGGLSWMITDWIMVGKPSVLGMVNGIVAGLVCITPASGFVDPTGGFWFGILSGPICYFGSQLKHKAGFDDALDAFGIHAIGGVTGGILTAFFASADVGGGRDGILQGEGGGYTERANLLGHQLYGICVCGGWSFFLSLVILKIIDLTMGLRISNEEEEEGLDSSMHGESIDVKVADGQIEFQAVEKENI